MEKQLLISCLFNDTFSAMSSCRPRWRGITIIVTQKQSQWHSYKKKIVLEHYFIPTVSGPDNYQEMGEWQNWTNLLILFVFPFVIWKRWSRLSHDGGQVFRL